MVADCEAVYKGIREIPAGSFVNEKGQKVDYKNSYTLYFDQIINGIPRETKIKITQELALNIKQNFKTYENIIITFDLIIYDSNNIKINLKNIRKK